MPVTLCDIQCGWTSCSRASARSCRGQFPLLGHAFPRTTRDQPQVQSRQEMKCPTVQKLQQESAFETPMWPVHMFKALLIIRPFQYEKAPPIWDEQGPLVSFLTPSSRTEQRLSLEPLGYILFNLNNTESSDIYQCICCSCLLPQPAVSRGIKYIHYGLWYCLWYTGRGQQMLSRSLFMA